MAPAEVPKNIVEAFLETVRRAPGDTAVRLHRDGCPSTLSWEGLEEMVLTAALLLQEMGVKRGDRVALCGPTCLEWTVADLAILSAGAITVPLYASQTAERMADILRDAAVHLLIADLHEGGGRCSQAVAMLADASISRLALRTGGEDLPLLGHRLHEIGAVDRERLASLAGLLEPSDVATIVFTSGTMGEQKGAVLTHGNVLAEILAAQRALHFSKREVGLICLPLAHVLGRMMQFYQLAQGSESAYEGEIGRLGEAYREIRPHYLCVVPRMLEKIHEMALASVAKRSRPARKLFAWALGIGQSWSALTQKRRAIPVWLALRHALADALVFRSVRRRLGGRLSTFICGGAPLAEEVALFFHACGILVLEGWGLTETFAAASVNRRDDFRFGSVGKPLPGLELAIAADGEILLRGGSVFREYLNRPEATGEAFAPGGWFRTGDLGEFTRDGFLRITGRKKEILVTAGGKNVAPQMIEGLMVRSPYIAAFMVYGDGRKYLTGLVSLNASAVRTWLAERGERLEEGAGLASHPAVRRLVAEHIEAQNRKLASHETIKRFAIAEGEFSVATGELTPTLKIRRRFTGEKYRHFLEALYEDEKGLHPAGE